MAKMKKDDISYNAGMWDALSIIASTWYGKQVYFQEPNGIIYSKLSHSYLVSIDDALEEFLEEIRE